MQCIYCIHFLCQVYTVIVIYILVFFSNLNIYFFIFIFLYPSLPRLLYYSDTSYSFYCALLFYCFSLCSSLFISEQNCVSQSHI